MLVLIQGGVVGQQANDAFGGGAIPQATAPMGSEQEEASKTLSLDELAVYEEY